MTNVIVATFDKESQAIKAMHKLSELESYGDISIYGKAIVRKHNDGRYEILEANASNGWRTLTGMVAGSLLGAIGGPVGFVVGLCTGTTIGMISDVGRQNFDESFVKKMESRMPPQTVSIIAEIDENSNIYVDNALRPFGAEIDRSDVDFEFDDYVLNEIDEIDKDLLQARENMKNAAGRGKDKIAQKIADLKKKRNDVIAKARNDAKTFKSDFKDAVASTRTGFIKNKIARHESKLKELNEELNHIKA
ncbi:MAG: DUF1269 domain-containing protein [Ignavibacteria bacterium]|nr:DUF1269 domain-containing protein [Ignavibacteria bacterium]